MDVLQENTVSDFYRGKTVLVTGASGSIGKVLIWKLLLSCSGIDTVYVLLRPKKGEAPQSRLNELLKSPIFDAFKKANPQVLKKVKVIPGDILEDKLGLSKNDEQMLVSSVRIIFHVAAIVKFDAHLKDAADMNVGGTHKLLELATKMPHLQAFVHTSTAYCCCDVPVLEEKVYKGQGMPRKLLELVKLMTPEMLRASEKDLIKPHPNTYTYTKRLAENLVAEYHPKLPVVITRPTIVGPSYSEPIPGWADDVNSSLISIVLGVGKGATRVVLMNKNCHPDIVPADMVCNSLILAAWKTGRNTQRPKEIPVYNVGRIELEAMSSTEILEKGLATAYSHPFSVLMWYPFAFVTPNIFVYTVSSFFLQWIPAYTLDALLFWLGKKPFMVRTQRRIHRGMKMSSFFVLREWNFVKNNILQIRDELPGKDGKIFEVSCKDVSIEKYYRNILYAGRWHFFKDDPANMPIARRRLKMLYALHLFVQLSFWLFVGWIFLRYIADPLLSL